jgi:hypothetical protein
MEGLDVTETDGKTTSIEWKQNRKYKPKEKRDVGRPMKNWIKNIQFVKL